MLPNQCDDVSALDVTLFADTLNWICNLAGLHLREVLIERVLVVSLVEERQRSCVEVLTNEVVIVRLNLLQLQQGLSVQQIVASCIDIVQVDWGVVRVGIETRQAASIIVEKVLLSPA